MDARSALGPADVSDEQLTAMVADLLGSDPADTSVQGSQVEEFPYELPTITTAGRYWVSGSALVGDEDRPWRMFVKHIQSWSRSPLFGDVPPEHREMAEASVPWRTEALAYRSDLRERLPEGLCMPRALGVFDLDEKSAAVWLEEVRPDPTPWDLDTYARAAHLLGRLAVDQRVAALTDVGRHDFDIRTYRDGRLAIQVLPMLRDEGIWRHPLVAEAFDEETRSRLLAAADRADDLVEEVLALPRTTSHGDACPNNLLRTEGYDGFVLIDFGFWGGEPVGFDLSQLLVGDVQVGRRAGDDLRDGRGGDPAGLRRGPAGRGVPGPRGRRAARARPAADDLHRLLVPAVGAPRVRADSPAARDRSAPSGDRPVQPRPARRHRACVDDLDLR